MLTKSKHGMSESKGGPAKVGQTFSNCFNNVYANILSGYLQNITGFVGFTHPVLPSPLVTLFHSVAALSLPYLCHVITFLKWPNPIHCSAGGLHQQPFCDSRSAFHYCKGCTSRAINSIGHG